VVITQALGCTTQEPAAVILKNVYNKNPISFRNPEQTLQEKKFKKNSE
jgi:hypothetical protein